MPMIGFGQNVNIPDATFKAFLVGNTAINTNGDTEIQVSEAAAYASVIVCHSMGISDLTGIEAFTALTELWCDDNPITSLDVSSNTALTFLRCNDCSLYSSLDVSNNTALTELRCNDNNLTSLDVSNNTALISLNCDENQLTSLDVSGATALASLSCGDNQLTSLDVSNNTALYQLACDNNQLTSLDVSNNTDLLGLGCAHNQLTSLDVSNNTALSWFLICDNNQLTSLDVSQNIEIERLYCDSNYIECLDISTNIALFQLWCNNNLLEQLNTKNGNWQNMTVIANDNNLTCVEVDNIGVATNDWDFDGFATFSTNCNYANPCVTISSIQEHTTNKELLKVTDLLGRETKQTNQPLFYIYDDGTVEKRIVIE
jgi:Leucine-rich repeat (LRR) protein